MIYFLGLYSFFALVTFGHLYRSVPHLANRHFAAAIGWPAYWIVVHGVSGTIRTVYATEGETFIVFFALFTLGHFFSHTQDRCMDAASCGWLTLKAVAVFIGFPFYWGWLWST